MAQQSTEPVSTAPSAVVAEPAPASHYIDKIYDLMPQCQFDGAQMLNGRDLARLIQERSNRSGDSGLQAPSVEAGTVTDDADEEDLMSWLKSKGPPVAEAGDNFVSRWGITMPDCDDTYVPSCYGESVLDKLSTKIRSDPECRSDLQTEQETALESRYVQSTGRCLGID